MIDRIRLKNFQGVAECYTSWSFSKESFLPLTYSFEKGNAYGLVSDFGCGSWGVVTCLTGRGCLSYSGEIYLNQNMVHIFDLQKYSCIIPEKTFDNVNSQQELLTPKMCIKRALSLSGENYSIEEIKKIFCLSDARFNRSIDYSSGEIWLISLAVNFALGKDLFCYPWLNEQNIERFIIACDLGIINFLTNKGKIILVPSSQKKTLKKRCDYTLLFGKTGDGSMSSDDDKQT